MSGRIEVPPAMTLIAYELFTGHGLALPLFGSTASANALNVAVPSVPGDPLARISDFEIYGATSAARLDVSQHRSATIGAKWIDVFVWDGVVHVGPRAELWESTEPIHTAMERIAPLSLLALAEGADRSQAARSADLVYHWLERDWGAEKAHRWQVDTYLSRVARRDIWRFFAERSMSPKARLITQTMVLVRDRTVLELRSPLVESFGEDDLPDLAFAVESLGWRLKIVFDSDEKHEARSDSTQSGRAMVMRLRHGRGRTQTQIPLRVFDGFFGGDNNLRNARTGQKRTMTLSMAGSARNTIKLQLPEIASMSDPVARFERGPDSSVYVVHDSASPEGRRIAALLNEGLEDGSTQQTQRGATWWRVLP